MMKSNDETTINVTDPKTETISKSTSSPKPATVAAHPLLSTTTRSTAKPASSQKTTRGLGGGIRRRCVGLFDFILRIIGLCAALAATITMGTTDQTLPFFTQYFQFHASYDDLPAFTFFVVANAIASAYLVLSLPFSIITIIRPHVGLAKMLLLILDTVMVGFVTAAAASAAAIVYLAHTGNSKANWVSICQQFNEFCKQISGAVVTSFVAAVIFIVLVIISALTLHPKHKH